MDGAILSGAAHAILSGQSEAGWTDEANAAFAAFADGARHLVTTFVDGALSPIRTFFAGTARLSWPFFIIMIVVAFVLYLVQQGRTEGSGLRGFLRYLKLRDVYLHPSSLLDYRYLLANAGLKAVLLAPFTGVSVATGSLIVLGLQGAFGGFEPMGPPSIGALIVYSLVMVMAVDLGNYWNHRLFHTIPALWELHKVHHSAPVLNPATAARVHPLESLSNSYFAGMFSGVPMGVFHFLYGDSAMLTAFGINVFLFYTHSVSGNLRHSHFWLSYGPRLERFLSSPAQHQIHHSADPKHFDKNFSVHFSFWDWVFGSLYTTTPTPEKLTFGIGPEGREFNSVIALWLRPLRVIARSRSAPAAPAPAPPRVETGRG